MKKMFITDNVGKDPELRNDQVGNEFVTFSVAVSVGTKQNPKTDWIEVSCKDKLAEIACNYVKKGTKILVDGFPTVKAYINKNNEAVAILTLYANNLELLNRVENDGEVNRAQLNTNSRSSHNSYEASTGYSSGKLNLEDVPF
jgi:single-strand DNA-binding protein